MHTNTFCKYRKNYSHRLACILLYIIIIITIIIIIIIIIVIIISIIDQSKQCAQIYLQKIARCFKLQLLIPFFVKSIISDMHHGIMYMYINFQQNRVCRSVNTVRTNLFAQYISQVA